jgi:hypothetical protein
MMGSGLAEKFSAEQIVRDIKNIPKSIKKGREGRRNRLKSARGRGTLEKENLPVLGMIQRSGQKKNRMSS